MAHASASVPAASDAADLPQADFDILSALPPGAEDFVAMPEPVAHRADPAPSISSPPEDDDPDSFAPEDPLPSSVAADDRQIPDERKTTPPANDPGAAGLDGFAEEDDNPVPLPPAAAARAADAPPAAESSSAASGCGDEMLTDAGRDEPLGPTLSAGPPPVRSTAHENASAGPADAAPTPLAVDDLVDLDAVLAEELKRLALPDVNGEMPPPPAAASADTVPDAGVTVSADTAAAPSAREQPAKAWNPAAEVDSTPLPPLPPIVFDEEPAEENKAEAAAGRRSSRRMATGKSSSRATRIITTPATKKPSGRFSTRSQRVSDRSAVGETQAPSSDSGRFNPPPVPAPTPADPPAASLTETPETPASVPVPSATPTQTPTTATSIAPETGMTDNTLSGASASDTAAGVSADASPEGEAAAFDPAAIFAQFKEEDPVGGGAFGDDPELAALQAEYHSLSTAKADTTSPSTDPASRMETVLRVLRNAPARGLDAGRRGYGWFMAFSRLRTHWWVYVDVASMVVAVASLAVIVSWWIWYAGRE